MKKIEFKKTARAKRHLRFWKVIIMVLVAIAAVATLPLLLTMLPSILALLILIIIYTLITTYIDSLVVISEETDDEVTSTDEDNEDPYSDLKILCSFFLVGMIGVLVGRAGWFDWFSSIQEYLWNIGRVIQITIWSFVQAPWRW